MIQRLQLTQPNLDTKPGTVSRDLFVDLPADQLARLYTAVNFIAEKQSLATTSGRDLDRLAANFGTSRNTGSAASGIVVFCTNSLVADTPIASGTLVTARNGIKFRTIGNFVMSATDKNRLAANANRMRKSLNIAGLSSQYALEVPVQATRPGTTGNVGSLQIVSSDISFPVNVTNLTSMSGGASKETDDSFRARILSVFSGANIGTSSGYRNVLLGISGVMDALVVEPGDSLMLRDGTETLETDDGGSRIINSGTGGKVDAYILGRKVAEASETFVFTDLSGSGDITDERNDHILGQTGQDLTRTSEERRVLAFKTGSVPAQPVDSIVSISGTSSGLLTEAFTDENGITRGSFELSKDLNPETGGSPFGFDKIKFISNTKIVEAESLSKKAPFGVDPLSFTDIEEVTQVYVDVNEFSENSEVSTAGSEFLRLLHAPVVRVSKVQNKSTGEVYSVVSQNLDSDGLNRDGLIEISGRSLPTAADVLSVNYTWRQVYDPYVDYGASSSLAQFRDPTASDAIDWTCSGGIFEEGSIITKSEDDLVFEIVLENNISKVISAYKKQEVSSVISVVATSGATSIVGVEIDSEEEAVDNVLSIVRASDGLELYNTKQDDGSFDARVIYLPSDSMGSLDDEVTVFYNKVELFDIASTDGSSYNNIVTLPSESVLESEELFDITEDLYLSGDSVYVQYVADISSLYPKTGLTNLPIVGSDVSNILVGLDGAEPELSNQPMFFEFDSSGLPFSILRYGATHILAAVSGISSAGKIKIAGTTLNRYSLEITAGTAMSGHTINIESELMEALGLSSIPANVGVGRVDKVAVLDSVGEIDVEYDLLGYYLNDITYNSGHSQIDSGLKNYEFTLPSTPNNSAISVSSGDKIMIDLLVYDTDGYEELYYESSGAKTSKNRFARINRASVSSGFRTSNGNLLGNLVLNSANQPLDGSTYFVDYNFLAPKEGERLTVSYNVNSLITSATVEIEGVRPVTADVLIKEASELTVDVEGTLLINDDAISEADKIVENVINSVTNLLNTAKLGSIIDYSDVISVAAAESGVDSVNISLFNETGKAGRKAFVKSLDNQTISPGLVIFEAISRNKFRIN